MTTAKHRRRAPGDGSIRLRSDGRWEGRCESGFTPEGKRQQTSVFARTKEEAAAKLREEQDRTGNGLAHPDGRTTLESYLNGWLERKQDLAPATRLRYAGLIQHQLIPHLGHIRLAKLTPEDVDAMRVQLQKAGLSQRTCAHARAVLRTALRAAESRGQVGRNAAALAAPVKVHKSSHKLLSFEEIHAVLDAVAGTDIENAVVLALNTGMRIGEVLGLRWEDVSFDTGQLTVTHSLQRLQRENRLVLPKSETSRRTLQLPGPALQALRAEGERQRELQRVAGRPWWQPIPDLVFTDELGAPLEGTTVLFRFQRALRLAGLSRIRFHDLRHVHAMLLLRNGVDIAVVRDVLGHSSIQLTADTYAGIMPALKEDAAARFEKLLQRPG
jgi:integrase